MAIMSDDNSRKVITFSYCQCNMIVSFPMYPTKGVVKEQSSLLAQVLWEFASREIDGWIDG